MNRRNSTMHRLLAGMADAALPALKVPPQNREAMRATLISVFEHQVVRIIGQDEVRLRGWKVVPSERAARQRRIVEALRASQDPADIARRENVSERWVRKVRAELKAP